MIIHKWVMYMPDYTSELCYFLPMFDLAEAYESAHQIQHEPVILPQGADKPQIPDGYSVLTTPTQIAVLNHETGKVVVADRPEQWVPPQRLKVNNLSWFREGE